MHHKKSKVLDLRTRKLKKTLFEPFKKTKLNQNITYKNNHTKNRSKKIFKALI